MNAESAKMAPIMVLTLILLVLGFANGLGGWVHLSPTVWGVYALLIFWLGFGVLSGSFSPLKLTEGADGRPSSSKFQFLLWTAAAIFSYVATYAARGSASEPLAEFPRNLLVAMGLSVTTLAGAKGITVAYIASGKIAKGKPAESNDSSPGLAPHRGERVEALVQDDSGFVDLTKVQMLAWTFIALFAYLSNTLRQVHYPNPTLADIDGALMVLTGLGQGAYLAKKLVTSDTPRVANVTKTAAGTPPVTSMTIEGESFGAAAGMVMLDGVTVPAKTWTDTRVIFTLPAAHPKSGVAWPTAPPPMIIEVGLVMDGRSSNTLPVPVP